MNYQNESPLFSFDGRHCDEFNVAFLPSQYPFVPEQTIPRMTLNSRHGSLRWPGRTFRPTHFRGTMFLLHTQGETDAIDPHEMLSRASEIAAWLCGRDGRGRLVLDALDDRYYVAELEEEAPLGDEDWKNGEAELSFICQPFARSVEMDELMTQTQAKAEKSVSFSVRGNHETMLAFDVTNTSGQEMDAMTISAGTSTFEFASLNLAAGETLRARYTEDDLLLLEIEGTDGAIRSAMGKRETHSDDDVLLAPGVNDVVIQTDRACSVKLSARGRWL